MMTETMKIAVTYYDKTITYEVTKEAITAPDFVEYMYCIGVAIGYDSEGMFRALGEHAEVWGDYSFKKKNVRYKKKRSKGIRTKMPTRMMSNGVKFDSKLEKFFYDAAKLESFHLIFKGSIYSFIHSNIIKNLFVQ